MFRNRFNATLFLLLLFAHAACAQQQHTEWRPVLGSKPYGISGMVFVAQTGKSATFLVVHDNKHVDDIMAATVLPRAALVNVTDAKPPGYVPLDWHVDKQLKDKLPKDLKPLADAPPEDLEGLATVPTQPRIFVALASGGLVYLIRLDEANHAVEALDIKSLPDGLSRGELEGLALQQFGAKTLIAWAYRGAGEVPGVLYWGVIELKDNKIEITHDVKDKQDIHAPWDAEDTQTLQVNIANFRHVADLKVGTDGVVYAAAAVDGGDNGRPFISTIYTAGTFAPDTLKFSPTPKPMLKRLFGPFLKYKIEALEFLPGAAGSLVFVFGTDDENDGSSIYLSR